MVTTTRQFTANTMGTWPLRIFVILLSCSATDSCLTSKECQTGQYCCKSHCTPRKIRCNDLCNRDEDCARNELCVQHMCIKCSSKRLSCDVKTCFNYTNCPENYECSSGKCTKVSASRALVSFVPFVVIIGVLGFALVILCYTEGCWKELVRYMKSRYGNYGSLAREEWEVDEPAHEEAIAESERNVHFQRNTRRKTRGREEESGNSLNDHTMLATERALNHEPNRTQLQNTPSDIPTTQTVSCDRQSNSFAMTSMMEQSHIRRGLRNMFFREMTSPNSTAVYQQPHASAVGSTSSGENPLFAATTQTSISLESLPTYYSLFREAAHESEPPPPRYEDVVSRPSLVTTSTRMVRHDHNSQNNSVAETVV